ncbi:tetratricopeptide repeat protein 12 isoform X2 [Anolis carolinensis]|uniref:tetratricopeptide repeat protein 12 isoform X2 n=1 Tax=Anolis carolinensis TaxID=28377 RepID=UPI002F2B49EF
MGQNIAANLIQGLNSADPSIQVKAIAETEKRLSSTKPKDGSKKKPQVDRTVVNTRAPDLPNHEEMMNRDGFMAALEKDAEERARRRKENEAFANALKDKGNDAFSKGDYEAAIEKYTEGLKKQKDMPMLYTNRAQAYIKLQKYDQAIEDCDWALRCDEKCIKALFHMGKAYLAQEQYRKSRECFLKILEIDPQKEKLCKGCIDEVDAEEKRQREEQSAKEAFESGKSAAVSVSQLLEKLSAPDKTPLYYAGGMRLLTEAVQDGTEQTLFRTNNGFSVINDNEVIRRLLRSETRSPADVELTLSLLLLWQAVCKGNEENQRFLLTHPDVNLHLPTLLLSERPEIQEQCLALLCLYAETESGRSLLVRHLDTTKWLQLFLSFLKLSDNRARYAMNLLTSLIAEDKFKIQCRIKLSTEALPLFTQLLGSVETLNELALAQCIAVMGDLCSDVVIHLQMAESHECWEACAKFVDECWVEGKITRYPKCLHAVLGLMMNLSLQHSLVIQEFAEEITQKCMSLVNSKEGRIVTRAIGLLSHILPVSLVALEEAMKQGVVKKMIKFLKTGEEATSGYALKTLAACVRNSRQAQEQIVKSDKKCSTFLKLLRSQNDVVVGNAAFCLGKCLEVPGMATNLLDTNVVKILLKVAGREAEKTQAQENAAIALGKLCNADARQVSRLRELNGMAVLNAVMKHVQH